MHKLYGMQVSYTFCHSLTFSHIFFNINNIFFAFRPFVFFPDARRNDALAKKWCTAWRLKSKKDLQINEKDTIILGVNSLFYFFLENFTFSPLGFFACTLHMILQGITTFFILVNKFFVNRFLYSFPNIFLIIFQLNKLIFYFLIFFCLNVTFIWLPPPDILPTSQRSRKKNMGPEKRITSGIFQTKPMWHDFLSGQIGI